MVVKMSNVCPEIIHILVNGAFMSMHYHVKLRYSKLLHNAELLSQVNAVTS